MLDHVIFFASLFLTASLFALVEIQIEGPHGWAEKLPTWRVRNWWTRLFFDHRALTGYHVYMLLFVICFAHLAFGLGLADWSARAEMKVLAFLCLFWVLEDFLWFVVNPAFGIRKFRPRHIPWHAPTWWLVVPRAYVIGGALGSVLYLAGCGVIDIDALA